MKKQKHWNDYLYYWAIIYFSLAFFNIVFAWLGMIDFCVPLYYAIRKGNKNFCNKYCARSQFYRFLGEKFPNKKQRPTPKWMYSKWFRYGFLTFFMTMFSNMIYQTYLVFHNVKDLKHFIKVFWTFKVPFGFAYHGGTPFVVKFSYGLYSLMLTSLLIGLITYIIYKPRTWCSFCPMGTMTQGICKLKHRGD